MTKLALTASTFIKGVIYQLHDVLDLINEFKKIRAKEENIKVTIDEMEYFDNKALYQFTIPTKSKSQRAAYSVFLQTLRIVALLHDVGHLPFSHQVEYALKKVYHKIKDKELNEEIICEKELKFKEIERKHRNKLEKDIELQRN